MVSIPFSCRHNPLSCALAGKMPERSLFVDGERYRCQRPDGSTVPLSVRWLGGVLSGGEMLSAGGWTRSGHSQRWFKPLNTSKVTVFPRMPLFERGPYTAVAEVRLPSTVGGRPTCHSRPHAGPRWLLQDRSHASKAQPGPWVPVQRRGRTALGTGEVLAMPTLVLSDVCGFGVCRTCGRRWLCTLPGRRRDGISWPGTGPPALCASTRLPPCSCTQTAATGRPAPVACTGPSCAVVGARAALVVHKPPLKAVGAAYTFP